MPLEQLTVAVVGWVPDATEVDALLDGWQAAMGAPNSIGWLAGRLRDREVPRVPPAA